ncbi:hypothetical protein AMTRI_Chr10g7500 [Amborella trichopoda]
MFSGVYVRVLKVVFSFQVGHCEHIFEYGEEICQCTFSVIWQHGPQSGKRENIHVEDICLLQPQNPRTNTILENFIMKCKEKFSSNSKKPRNRPLSSSQFCDNKCLPHEPVGPDLKNRKDGLPYNCNCPSNSIKKEALERDNRVSDLTSGNEKDGNLCGSRKSFDYYSCDDENRNLVKHDFCREKLKGRNDCRGMNVSSETHETISTYFVILIENLETDLSALDIMDFIYEQTFVLCRTIACQQSIMQGELFFWKTKRAL